jgi:hypothetical protein
MAYEPPQNLVLVGDHHIVRGDVFVIAGPPGVGKSRATLAFAQAGAIKAVWFGLATHCLYKTLIIQNENGRYRLKRELGEINESKIEEHLRICPPPPFGLCFWKNEFRDQVKRYAEEFAPEAVLFDPWNAIARDDKARDYLETFDIIRDVFPQGDDGPVIGISCHTRKPTTGERANGRELLNLLAGSYVLGSVPRCVFVMQHASEDVNENRVVWTCCKNNDGELGARSVWERRNGLFVQVHNFDWSSWDEGEKEGLFTLEDLREIFANRKEGLTRSILAKEIAEFGVSARTAYRRIKELEKSHQIKFQKGKGVFVLP